MTTEGGFELIKKDHKKTIKSLAPMHPCVPCIYVLWNKGKRKQKRELSDRKKRGHQIYSEPSIYNPVGHELLKSESAPLKSHF